MFTSNLLLHKFLIQFKGNVASLEIQHNVNSYNYLCKQVFNRISLIESQDTILQRDPLQTTDRCMKIFIVLSLSDKLLIQAHQ